MKFTIEHIALWCGDLEAMKQFYTSFFQGEANEKYTNESTGFSSYFMRFASDSARLELMQVPGITAIKPSPGAQSVGLAHFAIRLGDREAVIAFTERLRSAGCTIIRGPGGDRGWLF